MVVKHIRARAFMLALMSMLTFGSGPAYGQRTVEELARVLQQSDDFRVRVRAALELGRTEEKADQARRELEQALGDANASVRAAAAAALKALGSPHALPALLRSKGDSSPAVRAQIQSAIASLEQKQAEQRAAADSKRILVEMGKVSSPQGSSKSRLMQQLKNESRKKLAELPGVSVVPESGSAERLSGQKQLPVVLLTGRLRKLQRQRDGQSVVYSATVEYVVHKMPGRTIAAKVSGSARVESDVSEARDSRGRSKLRQDVLNAAVASAMRRAPQALLAAARD